MKEITNDEELLDLFGKTIFSEEFTKEQIVCPTWDGLDEDGSYIPSGSFLGDSMIQLATVYETSGYDCLFIQELLRLYMQGKLKVVK